MVAQLYEAGRAAEAEKCLYPNHPRAPAFALCLRAPAGRPEGTSALEGWNAPAGQEATQGSSGLKSTQEGTSTLGGHTRHQHCKATEGASRLVSPRAQWLEGHRRHQQARTADQALPQTLYTPSCTVALHTCEGWQEVLEQGCLTTEGASRLEGLRRQLQARRPPLAGRPEGQ
eukprot:1159948-Pelagomonas_calceolata.AAC.2